MRKLQYFFAIFIVLFVILGIVIASYSGGGEVHILADSSAFVSVAPDRQRMEEMDGELYLLVGITPAPFPKETKRIYHYAKKRGKTIWITIKDSSPEIKFKMLGGLSTDGYMRIKCNSHEEADALSFELGL
ncbi:MAG: hypothetical protein FWG75_06895 [Cystobacterineae bacterium]|nr:hypothetical protein [Cystobacterineae bacterium]